jgi:uncharacterized protein (TIGR02996 family)
MTEYEAILRGILLSTDDDVPRLVLADWLEENGQVERAAFIRAQVYLAQPVNRSRCNGYYCDGSCGHIDFSLPHSSFTR